MSNQEQVQAAQKLLTSMGVWPVHFHAEWSEGQKKECCGCVHITTAHCAHRCRLHGSCKKFSAHTAVARCIVRCLRELFGDSAVVFPEAQLCSALGNGMIANVMSSGPDMRVDVLVVVQSHVFAFEVDGPSHRGRRANRLDSKKQAALTRRGIKVVRMLCWSGWRSNKSSDANVVKDTVRAAVTHLEPF